MSRVVYSVMDAGSEPLPYQIVATVVEPDTQVGRSTVVAHFMEASLAVDFCRTWNGDTNKE